MTALQWLLGWILIGLMIGFGLTNHWWVLFILSFPAGVIWWFVPDWFNHPKDDTEDRT